MFTAVFDNSCHINKLKMDDPNILTQHNVIFSDLPVFTTFNLLNFNNFASASTSDFLP